MRTPPARASRVCALAAAFALTCAMAVALFAPDADAAKFSAAQSSDLVLGATSFTTTASSTATPLLNGLYYPNGVSVDAGGSVYVVDTTNQRVLRWGAAPSSNGEAFSNVLMKDPTVLPGPMQSWWGSTEGPTDGQQVTVSGDGATSAIAIADRGHNRVILSKGETTTNQGASTLGTSRLVLGQPNFSNTGTNIGATGLNNPGDVWTDGTKVAVADQDNHRILLWDSWPTMGQAADHVLGQTGYGAGNVCPNRSILSGTTCNSYTSAPANAAIAADTIRRPKGVTFDGTRLFVADTGNNRVLVWNTWPTTNGQAANYAIGQPDLTTFVTSRGCNATDLSGPIGVAVTTTPVERLAITVQNQNRVVTIDNWSGTAANQHAFTSVIGQTSLVSGCSGNRGATAVGGSAADNSLRDPNDAAFDSAGRLWVADTNNNRVLRFPSMAAGSSADLVLGQSGANALRSSVPNGDVSGNTFFHSYSYVEENGRVAVAPNGALALADPNDDSIRIWNSAPTATNQAYDVRWGQRNRYDSGYQTSNSQRGSATTGDATGVWTDGTRMLVADTNSNRVLVYTSMPASDSAPANYVLGHATFTSTGSGSGLNQMIAPGGVTSDGTSIYVADTGNDRVLVFRNFWATPANGKTADFQLGTAGGGTSATLLSAPAGVDVSQNRLVVADTGNHRIAVYADATGATGASTISAVIGQASYTANGSGGIATDVTQVSVAGNAAFWSTRHQALVLDPVPTSGFVTTGTTLIGTGQALTPSSSSTYSVAGVSARSGTTWVDDAGHARLLRFTDTSNPVIGGPPVATVRCDGTVDISWSFDESTTTEVYWDTVTRGGFGSYAQAQLDSSYSGLAHNVTLNFPATGTYYLRVRGVDWAGRATESSEISFVVPPTCPPPTTQLADDVNAQVGTGRANPSATNTPPISSTSFHTSWQNVAGVTMDRYQAQTWTTPPEQAGGVWHFDGATAGDANGSYAAVGTWDGTATYTTGRFGQAISLDGTTRSITVPSSAAITKTNDFSVDAWFRTSSLDTNYPIVAMRSPDSCGGGSRCNFSIEFDRGAGTFCAAVTDSTAHLERSVCRTATGLVNGQWHHAAMTVTAANQLSLYVDGVLAAGPLALPSGADAVAGPMTIGSATAGAERFTGELDEVRFSPMALSAGAIQGYYRTQRPHLQILHDTGTGSGQGIAIGADCANATRCSDAVYGTPAAGTPDILRPGARYWTRMRLHTKVNDYWSTWSNDWIETDSVTTISVTAPTSVNLGQVTSGIDMFATSSIQVASNDPNGYQLLAKDSSNTVAMTGTPSGTVPDMQSYLSAPALWAASSPLGLGFTVRDASGGRLAKWGATGPFPETDVANNRYTGLGAVDLLLHQRTAYSTATDTLELTMRLNAPSNQAAGAYTTTVQLTALAIP